MNCLFHILTCFTKLRSPLCYLVSESAVSVGMCVCVSKLTTLAAERKMPIQSCEQLAPYANFEFVGIVIHCDGYANTQKPKVNMWIEATIRTKEYARINGEIVVDRFGWHKHIGPRTRNTSCASVFSSSAR